MRESPLHPEFADLQGQVHYVVERIRGREWSSSCPKCGGEPHPRGEWPDRFRMWIAASSKHGVTLGWCRACDFKWTPKKEYKPDPAKIEQWRQERIAEETRRKEEAETALAHLRNEHKWQAYYKTLSENTDGQHHWWAAGFTEERNRLGDADHCPECLQETSKSWQPINSLIPIGERICTVRCKCTMEYRRLNSDGSYTYG